MQADQRRTAGHAEHRHHLARRVDAAVVARAEALGQQQGMHHQRVADGEREHHRGSQDGGGPVGHGKAGETDSLEHHQHQGESAGWNPEQQPAADQAADGAAGRQHRKGQGRGGGAIARADQAIEMHQRPDLRAEQEQIGRRHGKEIGAAPRILIGRGNLRRRLGDLGAGGAVGMQPHRLRARAQHQQRDRHDADKDGQRHPGRRRGETMALDQQRDHRGHHDAAEREARGADGERQRAAYVKPARKHGCHRHQAHGPVRETERDVEGEQLPHLAQHADRGQRQRADHGAAGDDEARIEAVDQPSGDHAADAAGDEEGRRGAAGEPHREAVLGHERGEQDRQIVERQPGGDGGDHQGGGHDIPAVEDAARRWHAVARGWIGGAGEAQPSVAPRNCRPASMQGT